MNFENVVKEFVLAVPASYVSEIMEYDKKQSDSVKPVKDGRYIVAIENLFIEKAERTPTTAPKLKVFFKIVAGGGCEGRTVVMSYPLFGDNIYRSVSFLNSLGPNVPFEIKYKGDEAYRNMAKEIFLAIRNKVEYELWLGTYPSGERAFKIASIYDLVVED